MSQLPDPLTLERFLCQGFENDSTFYVGQPQPIPRQISEYVVDAQKWEGVLPPDQRTVEGILSQRLELYKCIFCYQRGQKCWGEPCLSWWQNTIRRQTAARITLRDTGGGMGVGVFATRRIGRGAWLDDYVGELLPRDFWYQGDRYAFDLPGVGRCTSRAYGNWTRFVNHRCVPNVRANDWMVGQRVVMVFQAVRDIQPGEQLFIEYGRGYFEAANVFCKCDAYPGDHLPPPDRAPRSVDDEPGQGETVPPPEQGRRAAAQAKQLVAGDDDEDSSLLPTLSSGESTDQQTREEPTSSVPKHTNHHSAGRRATRTPRRQLGFADARTGWPRPEPEVEPVEFLLAMQRELQRRCQTPRRSARLQTPKAPRRRRRVGPSGPVSAALP